MKKYYLRYRYTKYKLFGLDSEWKTKSYEAKDINELIDYINTKIREYDKLYIIAIYEIEREENDIYSNRTLQRGNNG